MDKALTKPLEWLQRTKALIMDIKLSDYDDKNNVNRALDVLQCIDNAIAIIKDLDTYDEN